MRRKKYALIWWLNTGYKDVVELSTFPVKYRHVNAVSNLLWMNHETGVQTKAQAKILAISEEKTALDLMWVSNEGEILDPRRRVFSKEAIDKKSSCDQKNKLNKKIFKANKRKFESELMNQSCIFPDCRLPPKNTDMSPNFLAHQKPIYFNSQPSTSGSLALSSQRPTVGNDYRNYSLSTSFESNFENKNVTNSQINRALSNADVPLASEVGCTLKNVYVDAHNSSTSGSLASNSQSQAVGNNYRNSSLSTTFESNFENEKVTNLKLHRASSNADVPLASEVGCTSKNVYVDAYNSSTSGSSPSNSQRQAVGSNYRNSFLSTSFESNFENEKVTDSQIHRASSNTNVPLASDVGRTSKNLYVDAHNSSSDEDYLSNEKWSGARNALAFTFPGKVTARDIAFQTFLLESMKQAYKLAHPKETCNKIFEQEIVDKCGFFLPKNIIAYINTVIQTDVGVEDTDKWKILVRETLLEVYGNTIANYSARGRRGKKPSINSLLLKGLFKWACNVSPDIAYKDFIKFINKFAGNKRRYQESTGKKDKMGGLHLKKENSSSHQSQFELETRHDQQNAFDLSRSTPLNLEGTGTVGDGTLLSTPDQRNTFYLSSSQIEMVRNQQGSFNSNRATLSNLESTKDINNTIDWAKSLQPI